MFRMTQMIRSQNVSIIVRTLLRYSVLSFVFFYSSVSFSFDSSIFRLASRGCWSSSTLKYFSFFMEVCNACFRSQSRTRELLLTILVHPRLGRGTYVRRDFLESIDVELHRLRHEISMVIVLGIAGTPLAQ